MGSFCVGLMDYFDFGLYDRNMKNLCEMDLLDMSNMKKMSLMILDEKDRNYGSLKFFWYIEEMFIY